MFTTLQVPFGLARGDRDRVASDTALTLQDRLPPTPPGRRYAVKVRELERPFLCISRVAVATLLSFFSLSGAAGPHVPDFSGVWVETQPNSGSPLRLQLTQSGSRVQVRMSYRDYFPDRIFGVATIKHETAGWSAPQGCDARFRWPGYDYDNPGVSTFTLSLRQPTEPVESGTLLVYVQQTRWNAPCANNHPIGTERTQKILKRR